MEEDLQPLEPAVIIPQATPPVTRRSVPWTVRDAWVGLVCLPFVIVALAAPIWYYQSTRDVKLNAGVLLMLGELAILVPVIWFAIRRKASLNDLGFRRFKILGLLASFAGLFILYLLIMGFMLVVVVICMALGIPLPDTSPAMLLAQLPNPWLAFLVAVVAAPLTEELFFRGFFFAGLRQRYGWIWAAVGSAFFFGLFHLEPLQFLPLTAIGFLLAVVYEYTDSIWPPILLHASINLIGVSAAYFIANSGWV